MSGDKVSNVIKQSNLNTLDIANLNSLTQVVIAGPKQDVLDAGAAFESAGCQMYFPLNVGSAFHSRYMTLSRDEFKAFIEPFSLNDPKIPVIANLTAQPYSPSDLKTNLVDQMNHSVKWSETVQYLLGLGEQDFVEVGPGNVLTGWVPKIKRGQ